LLVYTATSAIEKKKKLLTELFWKKKTKTLQFFSTEQ
jgi:hypothetical protein